MSNKSAANRTLSGSVPLLPRVSMLVPPLLMILAGVLGVIFSIPSGTIGTAYLVTFVIAAVVSVVLVVPRGLVVTVAQIPILYSIITVLTAWFTGSFADPANGGATATTPLKARLITSAYPIIQHFPWLAFLMLVCSAIAIWRYLELTRKNQKFANQQSKEARKRQHDDEVARESASTLHRRLSESDERVRRSRAEARKPEPRRAAADIIRDAEERRKQRAETTLRSSQQLHSQSGQTSSQASHRSASRPVNRLSSRPSPQPESGSMHRERTTPRPQRRPIQRPYPSGTDYSRRQANRPESPTPNSGRVWGEHTITGAGPSRADEWPPRQERPRHSMRDSSRLRQDLHGRGGSHAYRRDEGHRREWGERSDRGRRYRD
ncbi:DUF6542 domain-containing protein [Corynebacterium lactis]|uniref:DUF6542 domain-containing protein n=1 Tax=Corynebacterium lactis TaxID=1231000 RepID=UPI000A57F81D|nr:DUF6542 domain-containing protein [Corynebacterium lactis]